MTSCLLTWMLKFSQNVVYSKRKESALMGGNSFLYEKNPIYMGSNNENDRVTSPESVPIQLK